MQKRLLLRKQSPLPQTEPSSIKGYKHRTQHILAPRRLNQLLSAINSLSNEQDQQTEAPQYVPSQGPSVEETCKSNKATDTSMLRWQQTLIHKLMGQQMAGFSLPLSFPLWNVRQGGLFLPQPTVSYFSTCTELGTWKEEKQT